MNMSDSIKEVLYTEKQLQARVKELGAQITKDYAGKDKLLLVSVLRGSYIFMASSIEDYHVIIVEDILDSGNTLYYLLDVLKLRKAASIRICTLLDKPERRAKPIQADYTGFVVPDAFVVGYGLDYNQQYRNLPYIGVLKEEVYR